MKNSGARLVHEIILADDPGDGDFWKVDGHRVSSSRVTVDVWPATGSTDFVYRDRSGSENEFTATNGNYSAIADVARALDAFSA